MNVQTTVQNIHVSKGIPKYTLKCEATIIWWKKSELEIKKGDEDYNYGEVGVKFFFFFLQLV